MKHDLLYANNPSGTTANSDTDAGFPLITVPMRKFIIYSKAGVFIMKSRVLQIFVPIALALFLSFGIPNHSFAGWYSTSWHYRNAITVQSGQFPSNKADFPFLVSSLPITVKGSCPEHQISSIRRCIFLFKIAGSLPDGKASFSSIKKFVLVKYSEKSL